MITEWAGVPSAHACWVSEDGATLFTGSETTNGHIISWDVTDVENGNVNLLDEWTPPGGENWSAHNLFVKGNYLYISYYVYGLQILNISDPTNMENAAYYDTFGETPESGIFSGAWGTYPYFNSNKVIISDMSTGLYVVNVDPDNLSIEFSKSYLEQVDFSIDNIYPNPFNPSTAITFSISEFGFTTISAYDLGGRELETLTNTNLNPGTYTIDWDASSYPSGMYFIKISSDKFIKSQKLMLVK